MSDFGDVAKIETQSRMNLGRAEVYACADTQNTKHKIIFYCVIFCGERVAMVETMTEIGKERFSPHFALAAMFRIVVWRFFLHRNQDSFYSQNDDEVKKKVKINFRIEKSH